ncbi:MAG: protein kinase [Deltaproteobacteria bacterium]|nr:protein kinase [Deltaproteobacteria bacterium]MBK8718346.1 protein kinase [Deltaproteobacteria bacterium]MBP7291014.1 protein kinase [Nannocystaceae bacterium]
MPIDTHGTGDLLVRRYRLVAVLGEGAMGVVWRARDLADDGEVAVKILHPQLAGDAKLVARFDREAHAGAVLDHPGCVRVLGCGTSERGAKFLVMPLLEGQSLRAAIDGSLALRRTLDIVQQLLAALEHIHGHGFVHRDVKPENVLLVSTPAGERVKLLDLGLVKRARSSSDAPRLTRIGALFGTPWYMAPEQAMGDEIDARADLYAVGAVMFEMLAGHTPFVAASLPELLHKHLEAAVPGLPAWVPAPIDALVRRLLAKRPEDRPATASMAAAELRAAVAATTSSPTLLPVTRFDVPELDLELAPPSMLRANQRHQRWFAGAVALAAALVAGLMMRAPEGASDHPTTTAAAQVESLAPEPAVAPAERGSSEAPAPPAHAAVAPVLPSTSSAIAAPADATVSPPVAHEVAVPSDPPRSSAATVVTPTSPAAAPRTSKPRVRPPAVPAPVVDPAPTPIRKLRATKPPRTTTAGTGASKLPGGTAAALPRDARTQVPHLRPRNT